MGEPRADAIRRQRDFANQLSLNPATLHGDLETIAKLVTESCSRLLGVARVGIWLFDDDEAALRCFDQFNLPAGEHTSGAVLLEHEFEPELRALKTSLYVDASEPLTDPRTAGYVDGYLKPHRITSMLDLAIRFGGKNLGALCFEHVDMPHTWEQHEIDFGLLVCAQLSILLERRELKRVDAVRREVEDALLQARKMESVGVLAGGLAHDLNNILAPVVLLTGRLLDRTTDPDTLREYLKTVSDAAHRASGVTRQLLSFARKQPMAFQPLDLDEIVAGFLDILGKTIRENVVLETRLAGVPLLFSGDSGQIEQVLLNLALNAQDAMPRGGTLRIATSEATPQVILSIADTGDGMDASTIERIFDPFFTTKPGVGTGLGLASAYGIVRQHGGDIEVDSVVGEGTTFRVLFPRIDERPEEAPRSSEATPLGGSETILVVEDQAVLGDLVAEMLSGEGYAVLTARTPTEALAMARREGPIDLLLTDVVMPGMNGRELHAALGASRPGLRVLYMSGYEDAVIAEQGVIASGVELVAKPFSRIELLRRVRAVLSRP